MNQEADKKRGLSRRDFAFKVLPSLIVSSLLVLEGDNILSKVGRELLESEIAARKYFIETNYGIEVIFDLPPYQLDDKYLEAFPEVNTFEKHAALSRICEEIIKYPTDIFNNNGIERLSIRSKPISSVLVGYSGLAIDNTDIVLPFIGMGFGLPNYNYRQTFHHEVLHCFDHQSSMNSWRMGAKAALKPYNWMEPEEDKANYAELVMMPKGHVKLLNMIKTETDTERQLLLRENYLNIIELYAQSSNGLMSGNYWIDLMSGQVNQNYWKH